MHDVIHRFLYRSGLSLGLLFLLTACVEAKDKSTGKAPADAISETVDTIAHSLKLPAVVSSGMVVQRDRPIRLTGLTDPGTVVRAVLSDSGAAPMAEGKAEADSDGHFAVTLPARKAGGPYRLTVKAGRTERILRDVYVGEVWLCSGQSNMELRIRQIQTKQADLQLADRSPKVHLFNMPSAFELIAEHWTKQRAESIDRGEFIDQGRWTKSSSKAAANFSAIGFHFARLLADSLGCHVGIISNSVGGSMTENWIDRRVLEEHVPELMAGPWTENPNIMGWSRRRAIYNLKLLPAGHHHPFEPGYLHRYAIRPLDGFPLRGILWYQGESNTDLREMHEKLFPLLVDSWRKEWAEPDLPFYYVQIAGLNKRPNWPDFRDSQRRLESARKGLYMTVSADLAEANNIHPTRKRPIAERLLRSALFHSYGHRGLVPSGSPRPERATLSADGQVVIDFSEAQGLRLERPGSAADFSLCGADGRFLPADRVEVKGNSVLLRCSRIANPTAVRFAWKDFTTVRLVNSVGLPCSTFELKID